MNYEDVVKNLEADVARVDAGRIKAENWLKYHQWAFVPLAFLFGLILGSVL